MSFPALPRRKPKVRRPAHARQRRRRFLKKCRRLGQAALFAAVRGVAYALGGAGGAWLIYWATQHLYWVTQR
jgi:hypothetical protein